MGFLSVALILAMGPALAAPPSSPSASDEAPSTLPTPFTADQIRGGMPVGLRIDWEQREGEVTLYPRWEVVGATTDSVTVRYSMLDADGGQIGEASERTHTFESLRQHAVFPEAQATRHAEAVHSDVGDGPGWRYDVRQPDAPAGTYSRFRFLTAAPGAPVAIETYHDGSLVTALLQARRSLAAAPPASPEGQ